MANLTFQDNKAIIEYGRTSLELFRETQNPAFLGTGTSNPNCWELIFEDGMELDLRELKVLNELGFVYHSEQTDIDYENEDGSTSYMNIYYFARVEDPTFFNDCMPF